MKSKNFITIWKDLDTGNLCYHVEPVDASHVFLPPHGILQDHDEIVIFSDRVEDSVQKWWITTTPPYEPEKHLVFRSFSMRLKLAWLVLWSPFQVLDELWRKV